MLEYSQAGSYTRPLQRHCGVRGGEEESVSPEKVGDGPVSTCGDVRGGITVL